MRPDLLREILPRLDRDFSFKEQKGYLRHGVCPSCNKKEMYVNAEKPWVLRCGRLDKCGAEYHVKELYPDLFSNWSESHPVTKENPNAAADAYLRDGRGFDLDKVKGWYEQESYYDHEKKIGSATVRFPLPGIGYWERIIDKPERFGKRKATFRGDYKGEWWCAPGLDLTAESVKEVWIVEGIFDNIALLHHDVTSTTALSCNNYPDKALKRLAEQCASVGRQRPKLVWALDTGKAGESFTRKHVERCRNDGWEAEAAQPPIGRAKLDWNELHQLGRLDKKALEEARYQGALLIAENAHEKALLMFNHGKEINSFYFGYDSRMFWFELNLEKFAKAKEEIAKAYNDLEEKEVRNRAMLESHTLRQIANCYFTALYYQANTLTDESWYYFRVDFPHGGPSVKNTFAGPMTTNAAKFKDRLISIAPGARFLGNSAQLDRIMDHQQYNIKTVQTIDFIGYSKDKEHGVWVFNDLAVKDGKVIALNDEDFFDIGKLSIKSLNQSVSLAINGTDADYTSEWINPLWTAFGPKGVAALAFWLGSLYAEQIRAEQKSYPFLEVVGEPGAGKSTLIEFMWKLLGRRDYEGFDPVKSTAAARGRNFAQVSNMPVVLIEADREDDGPSHKQRGFDWNELKSLYNGRGVRSTGVKNGGNDTREPPFRGAIVIAQNAKISGFEAVEQRICHLNFDVAGHNPETKIAAEKLERMEMESVSGFILRACKAEAEIMRIFKERHAHYDLVLSSSRDIKNIRIIKNHAQLMALVDALATIVPIGEERKLLVHDQVVDMAVERQQTIREDHPLVQEFWDLFDFLNGDDNAPILNHARDANEIAINLNHFVQVAADKRQQIPDMSLLKKVLRTSRFRKFVDIKPVNSGIHARFNSRKDANVPDRPTTVKCWVFKRSN